MSGAATPVSWPPRQVKYMTSSLETDDLRAHGIKVEAPRVLDLPPQSASGLNDAH
jgi:hypothetical protein